MDAKVSPYGATSVTETVPLVAAAPVAFETVMLYVAPCCPGAKLPLCVFVMLRTGWPAALVAAV
jgi:hypothetical protein